MTKRSSESYVMTVDPSKKKDMEKLDAVRTAIKIGNASTNAGLSVKCHGRLGISSPNASKYAGKETGTIKLGDASRWDVYVYGGKTGASPMKKKAAVKKS